MRILEASAALPLLACFLCGCEPQMSADELYTARVQAYVNLPPCFRGDSPRYNDPPPKSDGIIWEFCK